MQAIGCVFVVLNGERELFATDGFRWNWTTDVAKAWLFRTKEDAHNCVAVREKWVKAPLRVVQLILIVGEEIVEEEKKVG